MVFIKEQRGTNAPLKLDIGGAFSLLIGTASLLLFFNLGDGWGYLSQRSLGLLAGGVVFLALFIYLERRAPQPVLDLSFFKNRVFSAASIANFFQMFSSVAGPTLAPFLLINGLKMSSTTVGMLMALIAIPSVIISPISGWLSDRIGNRLPMVFGTLTFSVALFLLSRIEVEASIRHIALVFMLFGCGMGIFNAPNQSAIVGAVRRQYLATAMGVANTTRLLAATIGTALIGTLYSGRHLFFKTKLTNMGLDPYFIEQTAAVKGFQFVLLFAAGVSLLAVIASFGTGRAKQSASSVNVAASEI
jgi:MFS family permease